MKKVLLLALLGSFAALAMDAPTPMAGSKGKIIVKSINNQTDKDWVFVNKIEIPAGKTIQVNLVLDYGQYSLSTVARIQLDPIPNEGFSQFEIHTKKPYKIASSRQDKEKVWATVANFSQLKNPATNIQITAIPKYLFPDDYLLSFKPGALPKGKEKEEEEEEEEIRTLTYEGKQYSLDLNDEEPLSLETYKDLIKAGKELVCIVSKGDSGVFVHFYDKAEFEKYKKDKDKGWIDPITRLRIIGYIDIEEITDKELIW